MNSECKHDTLKTCVCGTRSICMVCYRDVFNDNPDPYHPDPGNCNQVTAIHGNDDGALVDVRDPIEPYDPLDGWRDYFGNDCIPLTGKPYTPTYPINSKTAHLRLLIPDEYITVETRYNPGDSVPFDADGYHCPTCESFYHWGERTMCCGTIEENM